MPVVTRSQSRVKSRDFTDKITIQTPEITSKSNWEVRKYSPWKKHEDVKQNKVLQHHRTLCDIITMVHPADFRLKSNHIKYSSLNSIGSGVIRRIWEREIDNISDDTLLFTLNVFPQMWEDLIYCLKWINWYF